jgi:enoyl-CoA hydratase/carnithine racemase
LTDATEAGAEAQVVRYEMIDAHVALVTLDRPDKRNAVNGALAQQLGACVKRAEADDQVRVVILTSSNDAAFCAGADLAEVAAGRGHVLFTEDGGFAGLTIARRRKPWIAAAKGAVLAGGMELALSCDMIVAADDCKFGVPEVKRSLVAAEGGVTRLVKIIPRAVALEMIATGDPISAQRAYDVGLINRMVPAADVMDQALALAKAIAVNAPLAVYASMALAKDSAMLSDLDARDMAMAAFNRLRSTEDFKEGPRAFLEKRAPVWKGA